LASAPPWRSIRAYGWSNDDLRAVARTSIEVSFAKMLLTLGNANIKESSQGPLHSIWRMSLSVKSMATVRPRRRLTVTFRNPRLREISSADVANLARHAIAKGCFGLDATKAEIRAV
jgi:hypothetical protein